MKAFVFKNPQRGLMGPEFTVVFADRRPDHIPPTVQVVEAEIEQGTTIGISCGIDDDFTITTQTL